MVLAASLTVCDGVDCDYAERNVFFECGVVGCDVVEEGFFGVDDDVGHVDARVVGVMLRSRRWDWCLEPSRSAIVSGWRGSHVAELAVE
jgi:hypothetical protein